MSDLEQQCVGGDYGSKWSEQDQWREIASKLRRIKRRFQDISAILSKFRDIFI